ncbi:nuclear transport factor 2 family protein [Flavobacterium sp. MAH-1]|uniref:Nuclear transport factor 2 family protein n=1 Tax=Flavobacterium agri TaxID=2743471 RepID=A0A7Y8Y4R9_9FLAO|nr:nuclear transport factor 2 family protein [Flavobacterium agri]NUY82358.1 nuclear transport factor 2 family protein [Flavobacterium agri]NYA72382.1 nuclear transport factor 2 family protein [Flavobacterium agri]
MTAHSIREEIIEIVNKLFIYTDYQEWQKLQDEIFTREVDFDMSSVGGENKKTTSKAICDLWQQGFKGIDSINHLAGNYIVNIHESIATVFAYATATHYKDTATNGKTREFVGSYDIALVKQPEGWRIFKFKYTLKYANGNLNLS